MATGTINKYCTKSETNSLISNLNTGITNASPSGVSVPTNTLKNIASINVKKGMNLIIGNANFEPNSKGGTGYRQVGVAEDTTSESLALVALTRNWGTSANTYTTDYVCFLYTASAAKTLYLNVKHLAGTTLTVTGRMQAYNLKS